MHLPEARSFTPAPSGAHRALCIAFIDCGTQKSEYKGDVSYKRKVQVRWELCDELNDEGRPFIVSKSYTWSMGDKAALRKDLESWRGKPFEKGDFGPAGFHTKKLLGVAALLTVSHKETNGNTYANVTAVSPLPKGMERPTTPHNKLLYLALEAPFDRAAFEGLSDKMREFISHSEEYQVLVNGAKPQPDGDPRGDASLDDDIPF
jgi:hypothetical protein